MSVSFSNLLAPSARQPSDASNMEKSPTEIKSISQMDCSKRSIDEAFVFLAQHTEVAGEEAVDLKRTRRKVDWRIVPIMALIYGMQALDKFLLNFAIVMGLPEDLSLKGNELNNAASSLWWAYLAISPLVGILLNKVRLGQWLAGNMFLWGIVVTCTAAVQNYPQLLAIRILMGVFDSALPPAMMLVSSQYYRKDEQVPRFALWYSSVGVCIILGGLTSYSFQNVHSDSLASWRMMFIVLGISSVAVGVLTYFILPDTPMDAPFLSDSEKKAILQHVAINKTGVSNHHYEWHQIKELALDPQIILLTLNVVIVSAGVGILATYGATLIKSFGYDSKQAALLHMPSGLVVIISTIAMGYIVRYHLLQRWLASAIGYAISLIGACLVAFVPKDNKAAQLTGLWVMAFSIFTIGMKYQWIAANVAGHTKRSCATAIISGAFAVGNIVAPYAVQPQFAPNFQPARDVLVVSKGSAMVIIILMAVYYVWENRRRDRKHGPVGMATPEENPEVWSNMTDKERTNFRYVY